MFKNLIKKRCLSYIRLGQFWNQAQCPSGKPVPKFSKNFARKNKKNIDVGIKRWISSRDILSAFLFWIIFKMFEMKWKMSFYLFPKCLMKNESLWNEHFRIQCFKVDLLIHHPQKNDPPCSLNISLTIHGNSPSDVSVPPTILFRPADWMLPHSYICLDLEFPFAKLQFCAKK